jgi:hypothetical protein
MITHLEYRTLVGDYPTLSSDFLLLGAAYVFSRPNDSIFWSLRQKLVYLEPNMWAGKSVCLYDNTILVSKTGDSSSAGILSHVQS